MPFSKLSEQAARDMLRDAADPRYREMNRALPPPCGKTPSENFEMMLEMLRFLEPAIKDRLPDRSIQVVKSFIL